MSVEWMSTRASGSEAGTEKKWDYLFGRRRGNWSSIFWLDDEVLYIGNGD